MEKSKVLIIGGTGYLGKRLVKASLSEGHETYVLHRPEIGVDIEKIEMLLNFKAQGAHLVKGSFNDYGSLVGAVKLVDVVICAISGVHIRSHQILLQLKLVDAIKEAGNRFLPSEFGTDPAKMENAMEPGRVTFDDKMVVRKAIEKAGIPFTYVSANCFAGYFLGGLCHPFGDLIPSTDSVVLLGDGNQKAIYVSEDDIATYTIKTIDDPRTLNKTLYLRPPQNILSQREVVQIWEKLIGKELNKSSISKEEFLATMKGEHGGEGPPFQGDVPQALAPKQRRRATGRRRYGCRAMMLETVAAVPGMVGGMLLHCKSLRRFEHSGGWIKALLEEAENERMHLMTFMEVAKPRWYERALVFTVQGVFFNAYFLVYLASPKFAHRVVGYLEEEAIHSYTEFLKELDKGTIENVPAPAIAIDYWRMPPNSTLRDVVVVVRADEAHHRDVNHFASVVLEEDSPSTMLSCAKISNPPINVGCRSHLYVHQGSLVENLPC
ncbi:hypothetical protein LguiB_009543 [Lonicera macranthoides]